MTLYDWVVPLGGLAFAIGGAGFRSRWMFLEGGRRRVFFRTLGAPWAI